MKHFHNLMVDYDHELTTTGHVPTSAPAQASVHRSTTAGRTWYHLPALEPEQMSTTPSGTEPLHKMEEKEEKLTTKVHDTQPEGDGGN